MFIRKSQTRTANDGTRYYSYRLVYNQRFGDKVQQKTLLNLGASYPVPPEHWPELCQRITELHQGRSTRLTAHASSEIETEARRIVAELRARTPLDTSGETRGHQTVDVDSLEMSEPRTVGVEHVGLWAMNEFRLPARLKELGVGDRDVKDIMAALMSRLADPGSDYSSWRWLSEQSALGELLDLPWHQGSHMRMYRASDTLMTHRTAVEEHMFERSNDLFGANSTITLYDLTNTYLEGEGSGLPLAARGRSKEKRTDRPLLTLGLVLDGCGAVRKSRVFAGNVYEGHTLGGMITSLGAPKGATVIVDAGLASRDNLDWLEGEGYKYIAVSRSRLRDPDPEKAVAITTRSSHEVALHMVTSDDGRERHLHCSSSARVAKEEAMVKRCAERFEEALASKQRKMAGKKARRQLTHLNQWLGRLKAKSRGIGQHYKVDFVVDPRDPSKASSLRWTRKPLPKTMVTNPGTYCLRSNRLDLAPEEMWRHYVMLTDVEAVFRTLKSELGLRPLYHHKQRRADGHLFMTVLAYQLVHMIRRRLQAAGIFWGWSEIRRVLNRHQRVSASFCRSDGTRMEIRRSTQAETKQLAIYAALGITPEPGRTRRKIVL